MTRLGTALSSWSPFDEGPFLEQSSASAAEHDVAADRLRPPLNPRTLGGTVHRKIEMRESPFTPVIQWIERHYSTPLMLVLLLASAGFFWLFNFSGLPLSNPELIKLSGREGLLDLMPYYTAQQAFVILGHYGVAGRELYLRFLAADFVFIPVYSLGFAFLMTRAVRALCAEQQFLVVAQLTPPRHRHFRWRRGLIYSRNAQPLSGHCSGVWYALGHCYAMQVPSHATRFAEPRLHRTEFRSCVDLVSNPALRIDRSSDMCCPTWRSSRRCLEDSILRSTKVSTRS